MTEIAVLTLFGKCIAQTPSAASSLHVIVVLLVHLYPGDELGKHSSSTRVTKVPAGSA